MKTMYQSSKSVISSLFFSDTCELIEWEIFNVCLQWRSWLAHGTYKTVYLFGQVSRRIKGECRVFTGKQL
ncbi:Uncharacterized protein APZ42_033006 [Daphnia magna]|uniref:Uncharacterized protein n=1 Tax=Daphnia magna TaxID=35525 RepID=A0A164LHL4_9CRUS|nr:Uncharacterized protein APZ42_033006 [Daphnia magna]